MPWASTRTENGRPHPFGNSFARRRPGYYDYSASLITFSDNTYNFTWLKGGVMSSDGGSGNIGMPDRTFGPGSTFIPQDQGILEPGFYYLYFEVALLQFDSIYGLTQSTLVGDFSLNLKSYDCGHHQVPDAGSTLPLLAFSCSAIIFIRRIAFSRLTSGTN